MGGMTVRDVTVGLGLTLCIWMRASVTMVTHVEPKMTRRHNQRYYQLLENLGTKGQDEINRMKSNS